MRNLKQRLRREPKRRVRAKISSNFAYSRRDQAEGGIRAEQFRILETDKTRRDETARGRHREIRMEFAKIGH